MKFSESKWEIKITLPGMYDKFQHSYNNQNSMITVED